MAERALTGTEITLASPVFWATIPWHLIRIKDDFGAFNRAWCEPGLLGHFILHLGPVGFESCTQNRLILGADSHPIRLVYIHELVHAWQGRHGVNYVADSLIHQCTAAMSGTNAYQYTAGSNWSQYNCEQQGNIVMDWFRLGMSSTNSRFRYIRDNIRKGRISP